MPNQSKGIVLITGATGYIATHLIHYLANQNYEIVALTRKKSEQAKQINFVFYDNTFSSIEKIFAEYPIAGVFHLAAHSCYDHQISDIDAMIDANVRLGVYILDAMRKYNCKKIINVGSYFQHYTDANSFDPNSLYAAFKQSFCNILDFYVKAYQFEAITLKLTDTYGPDDTRLKIINLLCDTLLKGKDLAMSPGEQLMSMVYIDDVVVAFEQAWQHLLIQPIPTHTQYFVANPKMISLKEMGLLIARLLGKSADGLRWGALDYRKREIMRPNIGALLPNWQPNISLENGLKRVIAAR